MTTTKRPPGRPKSPPGTQRTRGKAVRLSLNEWRDLVGPHRVEGESDPDLVVRLLRERAS